MKDKQVRLGFIGAGFMGQLGHIQPHLENPRAQLYAVAEMRPGLRDEVKRRYGFCQAYASGDELLADPGVDAVVAVTARPHTGPIALKVLKARKHLLTEKPMCGTLSQAEQLVSAASAAKAVYQVAYHRRHDLGARRGRETFNELVASGELGSLNYVRYHCFSGDTYRKIVGDVRTEEPKSDDLERWPMTPEWLTDARKPDYEHFVNAGCHFVNIVRFFLPGTPEVRFVNMKNRAAQLIALDTGLCPALIEIGDFGYNEWDDHLECYFTKGRLRISFSAPMHRSVGARIELYKGGSEPVVISPQTPPSWAFDLQARAFVASILDGAPNVALGADAIEDIRLIETIWRKETGA